MTGQDLRHLSSAQTTTAPTEVAKASLTPSSFPEPNAVRWWERVNARFALVLSLALAPLLVISLVQTSNLQNESQGRAEQAMLGATLSAATGEVGVIRFSQGAVAALAVAPGVLSSAANCSAAMRMTSSQIPSASLVAFVPKSGLMTCSSDGSSFDYSAFVQFKALITAQTPKFTVSSRGPISGTSVLLVTHPVFDGSGTYLGYTIVALPHAKLDSINKALAAEATGMAAPAQFWTFGADGEVLTANVGLDEIDAYLPRNRRLSSLVDRPAGVFNDTSQAGTRRTYAVVPIIDGQLFLMSSWNNQISGSIVDNDKSPYILPILMWALGMIVAAFAAEWLVSRHVRSLTNSLSRFARGDRTKVSINLEEAPGELREAGHAFTSMAAGVTYGEASLEDTIHQKEVLLREVHHRVKNNLQLIASIINMQMRKAQAPESKGLLKNLQDRIMALATIHRGLYQTSGMADVRVDELLRDIVRQIANLGSGGDRRFDIAFDAQEMHLIPDQAVPLSLLLTEAMANAMKYAGIGADGKVHIVVRLASVEGDEAVLDVQNTLASNVEAKERAEAADGTGLGDQLMRAFVQQLGGRLERSQTEDMYRLSAYFTIRKLAEAEERVA